MENINDKLLEILLAVKSGQKAIWEAESDIAKLFKRKCNLTPKAAKKFEYVAGRTCSFNFPEEKPDSEWIGATLDLIEYIQTNK